MGKEPCHGHQEDAGKCERCNGTGEIQCAHSPSYINEDGNRVDCTCPTKLPRRCPSCSNTKDLESEVIKEIMKPSTGGEKVSVTMVMCTVCLQEAPSRETICHDKYCSRAPTPPSTEEVLKIIPSEELDSDPKWQVALRDQGYRCEKTCELAGCHRCNPVPTESTCAVTGDEALFSHSCPNPYDHVPPPEEGEWVERFDKTFGTRWINAEHGPEEIKSFIRSVLSSQSSAFQKKIGEVSNKIDDTYYQLTQGRNSPKNDFERGAQYMHGFMQFRLKEIKAADRIKKENL